MHHMLQISKMEAVTSAARVSCLFRGKTYQLVGNKNKSKASLIFLKIVYFMEDKITWPFEQVIAARNRQDFRKI